MKKERKQINDVSALFLIYILYLFPFFIFEKLFSVAFCLSPYPCFPQRAKNKYENYDNGDYAKYPPYIDCELVVIILLLLHLLLVQ